RQQAELPANCTGLRNLRGTAPGMWFEVDNKVFVSMPGVPYEMKGIMENEVLTRIKSKYALPVIIHKHILTCGIGESFLAEKIKGWEEQLPENISLAYLPSPGKVKLRLTAHGTNRQKLIDEIEGLVKNLAILIGDNIYGYDDETLEG